MNAYGKNGRLLVRNFPTPFCFSTSYTHEKGILALSTGYSIGIDIEYMHNDPGLLAIAKRYFYPEEWNRIRSLPIGERMDAFYVLWTLKEAYLKVIGAGWAGWRCLPDMADCVGAMVTATPGSVMLPGAYLAWVWMEAACCQALVSSR